VCKANAIAWCTRKSPGPIGKNSEFFPSLIALNQPGNQILLLAFEAKLPVEDNKTSNPYRAFPEEA